MSSLPTVYLQLNNDTAVVYDQLVVNSLRIEEVSDNFFESFLSDGTAVSTTVIFDKKSVYIEGALYQIYLTLFVGTLLLAAIQIFSHDVQSLVIGPVEVMIDLVKKMSTDPLGVDYKLLSSGQVSDGMETTLLLLTLNKIGSLMRVGFGSAGAAIISANLSSTGAKLNLLSAGKLINSIFGFCEIRHFLDTTECLQEEVLLFVNRIALILHGIVIQCSGEPHKNVGNAFLLTWKLDEGLNSEEISVLADKALLCFCRTIVKLERERNFVCNFSDIAMTRLNARFPGYKLRVGFGLHAGWAIEGAIGSNSKIDASYLSPHVKITEFLGASTEAYGVSLLISEPFFNLLPVSVKRYVRQIDRLRLSEQEEPFGIFTYDMDLSNELSKPMHSNSKKQPRASLISFTPVVPMNVDVETCVLSDVNTAAQTAEPDIRIPKYDVNIWDEDSELIFLRREMTLAKRALWNEAFSCYLQGDWDKACFLFRQISNDGPSKTLIRLIEETGDTCRSDLHGYYRSTRVEEEGRIY